MAEVLIELKLRSILVGDGVKDEVLLFVGDFHHEGVGVLGGQVGTAL